MRARSDTAEITRSGQRGPAVEERLLHADTRLVTRLRLLAAAVVATTGLVGAIPVAASFPTSLCALGVSAQLHALPVSTTCIPLPTRARKGITLRSVKWVGPAPRGGVLEIVVTTGMSESEFKQSLGLLGKLGDPWCSRAQSSCMNGSTELASKSSSRSTLLPLLPPSPPASTTPRRSSRLPRPSRHRSDPGRSRNSAVAVRDTRQPWIHAGVAA